MISAKKATLHELQTVYSLRDLYDLLEIIYVDIENERIATEWQKRKDS